MTPRRVAAAVLTGSLCLLSPGCTIIDRNLGADMEPEEVDFEPAATVGDVLDELGPPTKISALPGGFALVYEYITIREKQLGLGLDLDLIRWFKFTFGNADARLEAVVLTFDEAGNLCSAGQTEQELKVGSGMGVQLFIALEPVVDTTELEGTADPNAWGRFCLLTLPTTLNRRQNLETGESGVALSGDMRSIGQHTLELRQ